MQYIYFILILYLINVNKIIWSESLRLEVLYARTNSKTTLQEGREEMGSTNNAYKSLWATTFRNRRLRVVSEDNVYGKSGTIKGLLPPLVQLSVGIAGISIL
jgi:hypothetical protein